MFSTDMRLLQVNLQATVVRRTNVSGIKPPGRICVGRVIKGKIRNKNKRRYVEVPLLFTRTIEKLVALT